MWLILIESFLIESDLDFLDFLDCGLLKGCLEVEKRGSVIKAPHHKTPFLPAAPH